MQRFRFCAWCARKRTKHKKRFWTLSSLNAVVEELMWVQKVFFCKRQWQSVLYFDQIGSQQVIVKLCVLLLTISACREHLCFYRNDNNVPHIVNEFDLRKLLIAVEYVFHSQYRLSNLEWYQTATSSTDAFFSMFNLKHSRAVVLQKSCTVKSTWLIRFDHLLEQSCIDAQKRCVKSFDAEISITGLQLSKCWCSHLRNRYSQRVLKLYATIELVVYVDNCHKRLHATL